MPIQRKSRSRLLTAIVMASAALLFSACDKKSPTGPPQPGSQGFGSIVRIEILAPLEIEPGTTAQLTANAIHSDGSRENVSSKAQWASADARVLQIAPTGLATGVTRGESLFSARFAGLSAGARMFVLPRGTFRISGTTRENSVVLANVEVTATSGSGEVLTTRSGATGNFVLYGVAGSVVLRTKKEGYADGTHQMDVATHTTLTLNLVPEKPRTDYRGTYTFTVTAAGPCPALFPESAIRRVYTATVAQDGGLLTVTLSGPDFIVTNGYGNRFFGFVDVTEAMTFQIGTASLYYGTYSGHSDIVERFGDGALIIAGELNASGTSQRISGTLRGSILISSRTTPPFIPASADCSNGRAVIEMVRR